MSRALLDNVRDLIDAQLTCERCTSVIHINRSGSNEEGGDSEADDDEEREGEEGGRFAGCFRVYV